MPVPDTHFELLEEAIPNSRLTVFYGAGINYAQRPDNRLFDANADFMPTGAELSSYLAATYQDTEFMTCEQSYHELADDLTQAEQRAHLALLKNKYVPDLARSSQYAQIMQAKVNHNLQLDLHRMFSKATSPTAMHRWLAELPARAVCNRQPVFVTTNYDVLLEHALAARGIPFDVLFYREPGGGTSTWLYHWKNAHNYYSAPATASVDGWDQPVIPFEEYQELPVGDGTRTPPAQCGDKAARVILVKIHGTVSPEDSRGSSFVITQNDYISFLRRVPADKFLPDAIFNRIMKSHFLFLGYGLGDMNILALCQNLWSQRMEPTWKNWSIQHFVTEFDRMRWPAGDRGVAVFEESLTNYEAELRRRNL